MMKNSHVLWTSNYNITTKYGSYFDRSYVIDVPINIQEIQKKKLRKETEDKPLVKVCFAGSMDHVHMIDEMLSPVINNIAEKYKDKVYFFIVKEEV